MEPSVATVASSGFYPGLVHNPQAGRLLLLGFERSLSNFLVTLADQCGFEPIVENNFFSARKALEDHTPDVLVLSDPLGRQNGSVWCRAIRRLARCPMVVYAQEDNEYHHASALYLGVDEFLVKDTPPRIIAARLHNLVERWGISTQAVKRQGRFEVNLAARQLSFDDRRVPCTSADFELFLALFIKQGTVVSRAEILNALGQRDDEASLRALDTRVYRLRRQLVRAGAHAKVIACARDRGYVLLEAEFEGDRSDVQFV